MDKQSVEKFIRWSFNFDYFSISKMCSFLADNDETLASHIKDMFDKSLDHFGRTGVAIDFYISLDAQKQALFIKWIDNNYDYKAQELCLAKK